MWSSLALLLLPVLIRRCGNVFGNLLLVISILLVRSLLPRFLLDRVNVAVQRTINPGLFLIESAIFLLVGKPIVPVIWEEVYTGGWPRPEETAVKVALATQSTYVAASAISAALGLCYFIPLSLGLGQILPLPYREGRYLLKFSPRLYLLVVMLWLSTSAPLLLWKGPP